MDVLEILKGGANFSSWTFDKVPHGIIHFICTHCAVNGAFFQPRMVSENADLEDDSEDDDIPADEDRDSFGEEQTIDTEDPVVQSAHLELLHGTIDRLDETMAGMHWLGYFLKRFDHGDIQQRLKNIFLYRNSRPKQRRDDNAIGSDAWSEQYVRIRALEVCGLSSEQAAHIAILTAICAASVLPRFTCRSSHLVLPIEIIRLLNSYLL